MITLATRAKAAEHRQPEGGEYKLLRALAKAAGFLAYLFITLAMLFMVTPFALYYYYYSVYSPLLAGSSNRPARHGCPAG